MFSVKAQIRCRDMQREAMKSSLKSVNFVARNRSYNRPRVALSDGCSHDPSSSGCQTASKSSRKDRISIRPIDLHDFQSNFFTTSRRTRQASELKNERSRLRNLDLTNRVVARSLEATVVNQTANRCASCSLLSFASE